MASHPLTVLSAPSLVAVTGKRHGLGNRVRVVLGARSLARAEGRRFFYTWSTGADFGARFDQLWQIDDATIPRVAARILSARFPFRDEKLEWLDDAVRAERVVQIRTPHALHLPSNAVPWASDLQNLHPVEPVATRVSEFFDAHFVSAPYVGVMVRAHPNSHHLTLRESPIDWYLTRMQQIRRRHPDIRFFVSADTVEAQQRVVEAVPGSFALSDKGGYNTTRALQSSVADLYLLASSTHILAPYFSSFPELSQKLAGADLALETSHTTPVEDFALMIVNDPTQPHRRHLA
ncbi:MAG TPA: hypothetical protein VNT53_04355 [Pseudolysinimonas sp.]|nr:hypothetical protein [Pseudolysinimonas sp.]